MNRVRLIEESLRCQTLGLLSLIPAIGLPLVVFAIGSWWRLTRASRSEWNPARPQLHSTLGFAIAGTIVQAFTILGICSIYLGL